MNQSISFNIYVMSYKRSNTILSERCFDYCTYCVRESERELYENAGVKNILAIPDTCVCDFMSTFYWIIENTPEDVICIADDDIKNFIYRLNDNSLIVDKNGNPDKSVVTEECERIAQLLADLNIGLAYDNPQRAPYAYDRELAFKGMPGHIRWVNKSAFKAKYNADDPASSDIDMAMQELLMNRIILLPKYFMTYAMMDKNEGIVENRQEHIDMTIAMKNKWGKYYDYNYRKNEARINVQK